MSIKNTPKQSNKSFKHKKGFKKLIPKTKLGWFFVICAVIVIGLTIYSIIVINNRPKVLTKDQAKEFLQKQANDINLPGEVVYEKIIDDGCRPISVLGGEYCTYKLKKYFKHSGSKQADLTLAENALIGGGCVKSENYIGSDSVSYYFEVPNEAKYASCDIRIFSLDNKSMYVDAKELFGIDQDIPLQDNEYTYGIFMSREYEYDPNAQ